MEILYILLCILVSALGHKRKIGSVLSFIVSLFLTPVVGLVVTLLSPTLEEDKRPSTAITDLSNLKELRDNDIVSEEEYEKIRKTLINKIN